jgi:hypothetical protein
VSLSVTRSGSAALKHADRAMAAQLSEVLGDAGPDRDAVVAGLGALARVLKERRARG